MASKRSHEKAFGTEIIAIFVRPHKYKFSAHKAILTKCAHFKACLEHNLEESRSHEIYLPDDEPDAFQMFLEYLYSDRIRTPEEFDPVESRRSWMCDLTELYIAADKYCLEELHNKLVSAAMTRCILHFEDPAAITMLTKAELVDSALRKALVKNMAYNLMENGFDRCVKTQPRTQKFIQEGGINVEDVLRAGISIATTYHRKKNPAKTENVCDHYHLHHTTRKCPRGLESLKDVTKEIEQRMKAQPGGNA